MTRTPGPFFAWRLARATKRYVSAFRRMHLYSESRCHHPVTRTIGYLNFDLAFVPPERVLRAAPVPRVFRLGTPRASGPTYTVRNARASDSPPRFTVLGGSPKRRHTPFLHCSAFTRDDYTRVECRPRLPT